MRAGIQLKKVIFELIQPVNDKTCDEFIKLRSGERIFEIKSPFNTIPARLTNNKLKHNIPTYTNARMEDFGKRMKLGEPDKKEKGGIWQAAIGLQQVDGLTPSTYLLDTARQNIEGDITFAEIQNRIEAYYETAASRQTFADGRTEEADKVSARIAEILSVKTFSFSVAAYLNIHRRLFAGIYEFAGKIRGYNITKSEWVLNGDTVVYAGAGNLRATLEHDLAKERKFSYERLTQKQIIEHIARFTADLWQIHPFGEGNTRTTAVFLINYLRELGFKDMNYDMFAQHSLYFRNSLVRANYKNPKYNVYPANVYLERFLQNLLLGEKHVLKNGELHIHKLPEESSPCRQVSSL